MGRLLTALRRLETRVVATASVDTLPADADACVRQLQEDSPCLEQEADAWPETIDHDPGLEYPTHWPPPNHGDWPFPIQEVDLHDEGAAWPSSEGTADLDEVAIEQEAVEPAVVFEDAEASDPIVEAAEVADEAPAETASIESLWPPSLPSEPEAALDHLATLLGEAELVSPAPTVADVSRSTDEEVVFTHLPPPTIDMDQVVAIEPRLVTPPSSLPLPLYVELQQDVEASQPSALARVGKLHLAPEMPVSSEPEEELEEPPISLRMPGFGRPNRPVDDSEHPSSASTIHRPALMPFLPPAQRPYREACECILAALPPGRNAALVLAWADDDLDHCMLTARLAEIMADRLDDPVLLIDVGAQRRLSSMLQAPAEGSLSEALVGLVSWRDLIVQTSTAGLCVLPSAAGDFNADPVAVARLIEACKEDFAIVLIAGGALRAIPDNVLAASDAGVMLVEQGHTAATAATAAIERLRRSGTDVLGCLLTAVAE